MEACEAAATPMRPATRRLCAGRQHGGSSGEVGQAARWKHGGGAPVGAAGRQAGGTVEAEGRRQRRAEAGAKSAAHGSREAGPGG